MACSEVSSQVLLFTSEQPKKNKMAFVGLLPQIKLLFDPLVIQLMWYILKQLFSSVPLCGSVNIYNYSPPLRWIIVNYPMPSTRNFQLFSINIYIIHGQGTTLNVLLPFFVVIVLRWRFLSSGTLNDFLRGIDHPLCRERKRLWILSKCKSWLFFTCR